jgi:uncharacterized phiE125 gp8 family phage protein
MSAVLIASGAAPLTLAEARDWLRLGPGSEDAQVAALIRAAANMCEAFTGQLLIEREVVEERAAAAMLRLGKQPVAGVDDVLVLGGPGAPAALATDQWAAVPLAEGAMAVRLPILAEGRRVRVRYRAGLVQEGHEVPSALRQGLLRLVQHWHFGGQDDVTMPAIVTALWTPWRRTGLAARPGGRR